MVSLNCFELRTESTVISITLNELVNREEKIIDIEKDSGVHCLQMKQMIDFLLITPLTWNV